MIFLKKKKINIKKNYNFFYIIKLWLFVHRSEKKSELSELLFKRHSYIIGIIWLICYYIYNYFWELRTGVRAPWYEIFVHEIICDGEELKYFNLEFFFLFLLLPIFYILYYFFYYKRRIFYEKKKKNPLYEIKKWELFQKAYGINYALAFYFEKEKIFLSSRCHILLDEFIDGIFDDLFLQINILLSQKNIDWRVNLNPDHALYNEHFVLNLEYCWYHLFLVDGKKLDKNKDKDKIILLLSNEFLTLFFSYIFLMEEVILSQKKEVFFKIFILKKIYEEAYYTKNLDLDSLKKKYNSTFFYSEELFFFSDYRYDLEVERRMQQILEERMNS